MLNFEIKLVLLHQRQHLNKDGDSVITCPPNKPQNGCCEAATQPLVVGQKEAQAARANGCVWQVVHGRQQGQAEGAIQGIAAWNRDKRRVQGAGLCGTDLVHNFRHGFGVVLQPLPQPKPADTQAIEHQWNVREAVYPIGRCGIHNHSP